MCYCDSPEQWIEVSRREEEKRKEEEEEEEEEVSWTSSVMYFYRRRRRDKILPPLSFVARCRAVFCGKREIGHFFQMCKLANPAPTVEQMRRKTLSLREKTWGPQKTFLLPTYSSSVFVSSREKSQPPASIGEGGGKIAASLAISQVSPPFLFNPPSNIPRPGRGRGIRGQGGGRKGYH